MSFEVEGKLYRKFEIEKKTDTFNAREFVIEINSGNYPQFVKFQLVQDRCNLVDPFKEGEQIKVHFDLRGREWNGKFFTNLNAWRVEKVEDSPQVQSSALSSGDSSFPSIEDERYGETGNDDLPF